MKIEKTSTLGIAILIIAVLIVYNIYRYENNYQQKLDLSQKKYEELEEDYEKLKSEYMKLESEYSELEADYNILLDKGDG